ncbi:MAG: DUF922 domain-containing protein [Rhizobiaceae bacterium]|nr:DUF922 domain-containing Zn-dependent protease [Hyphomicrobiales bacterium]NRB32775.1 DUF922 domain-containing protein [Rhizobiaceae bacterium]
MLKLNRLVAIIGVAVLAACQSTQESQVAVDYYRITGNSTADLDAEIRRKGPKINGGSHAVAVARIKMLPRITFEKFARGCRVENAKVAVDARVTLPQWTGRDTADPKLAKAWDNIDRYTRLHEATHVNIAFSYAKRIEDEVRALPTMQSCSQIRAITKSIVDRNLKEHDAAQRKYDEDEQKRFSMLAKRTKITESL